MYSCSFPVYFNSPHTPPLSYRPSCVFFSIWRQWWKLPSLHHDRIRANSLTFAPCCKCQVSFIRPVISLLNNSRQNAHTPLRNVCVAMCRNGICPSEDDYNFDFLKFMVLAGKSSCSPVSTEPTHINQDFMRTEASWKGEKKEMWSCDRVSPIHCRHLSQQLGHPGCVENQISKLRPLQSNQWFMQQKKKKCTFEMGIIAFSLFLIHLLCEWSREATRELCDLFIHSPAATAGSEKEEPIRNQNRTLHTKANTNQKI